MVTAHKIRKISWLPALALAAWMGCPPLLAAPPSSPVVAFSSYLGGSGNDFAVDVGVDADGNTYVAGLTTSLDFPLRNAWQPTYGGGDGDAFLLKLDPRGRLVWSTYLGGPGRDDPLTMAVAPDGHVWIVGVTESGAGFPWIDPIPGIALGGPDGFVVRLDPEGRPLFASPLGGSDADRAIGAALGNRGDLWVGGSTHSSDFPTTPDALDSTLGGRSDAFLVRVTAGGDLAYSTLLGGEDEDAIYYLATDSAGSVLMAGYSRDFPLRNPLSSTSGDAFAARLAPSGELAWATYLGAETTGGGYVRAIAADPAGNAYVLGHSSDGSFTGLPGPASGEDSVVLLRIDRRGNLTAAAALPGLLEFPYQVVAGPREIWLAGHGAGGATLARLDRRTLEPVETLALGGDTYPLGLAVGPRGSLHLAGPVFPQDLPVVNAFQPAHAGQSDSFVARIDRR